MKRKKVVDIINQYQTELQEMGVKSLTLFGSVARDEASPGSDVDLLVEFNRPMGLFGLIEIQTRLEELLGCKVDLGTLDSLKHGIREIVLKERYNVTS